MLLSRVASINLTARLTRDHPDFTSRNEEIAIAAEKSHQHATIMRAETPKPVLNAHARVYLLYKCLHCKWILSCARITVTHRARETCQEPD